MSSFSRLYLRKRGAPGDRVWMRCETATPPSPDPDASAGDVCIVKDGASSTILQYDGSTWSAISGSPSSTPIGYYSPEAPPSTGHANNLEFDSASDLSGMTSWNPGSLAGFAGSVANSTLRATTTPQAAGTVRIAGWYVDSPGTAQWSAWTRVSFSAYPGGAVGWPCGAGLFVVDDDIVANPTTCDFYGARMNVQRDAADGAITVASHSNYTNAGSNLFNVAADRIFSDVWLRVRYTVSGTTLAFDCSRDGCGWKQVYQTATPSPVPTKVGLWIVSAAGNTDPPPVATFDFLRFSESSTIGDATLGRAL